MGLVVTELVPVKQIEPQHEVKDPAKARAIARSIRREGWRGRPLVVADFGRAGTLAGKRYLALTGTHRLAALRQLREKRAPAVVVDVARWSYEDARELDDAVKAEHKAGILERRGKRRLARWVLEEGWPEWDRGPVDHQRRRKVR